MTLQERIDAKKHQLFFIELNKDVTLGDRIFPKGLDLPVDPDAIKVMVTHNKDQFDFKQMLRDMCIIIGLDPSFNHAQTYREMLGAAVSNPYNFCMGLGVKASAQGHFIDAIAFFKAALVFEEQFDAYYHLGRVHYALAIDKESTKGALAAASDYFLKAKSVEMRPEVDYYLTFVLHLEERHVEALQLANSIIKSELEETLALDLMSKMSILEDKAIYQMGVDHILEDRFQEGLEELLSLSEIALDDWRAQFFIGLGYRGIGQYSQGLSHLLRAKALNPGEDRIYNELGVVAMMLDDYGSAKNFFTEGLKIKPLNSDMLCNMGIVLMEAGEWEKAEKFIEEAYQLDAQDSIILQTRAYFQLHRPSQDVKN